MFKRVFSRAPEANQLTKSSTSSAQPVKPSPAAAASAQQPTAVPKDNLEEEEEDDDNEEEEEDTEDVGLFSAVPTASQHQGSVQQQQQARSWTDAQQKAQAAPTTISSRAAHTELPALLQTGLTKERSNPANEQHFPAASPHTSSSANKTSVHQQQQVQHSPAARSPPMHMQQQQDVATPPQPKQQQQQFYGSFEQLQQQLLLETKAREELQDMLLRYERQLKSETAARQAAESAAAEALAAVSGEQHTSLRLTEDLEREQAVLQQDRAALEGMRADFETQLHTARSELAKAQAALASNEAQVRSDAASACARLASDYEGRMALLSGELERTRAELALRTHTMAAELNKWRRQASAAAAAVLEAKDEVVERKRELDTTKDKMDALIDKLYAGKEANSNLSGAIAAAASYQQNISSSLYGPMQDDSPAPAAASPGRTEALGFGSSIRRFGDSSSIPDGSSGSSGSKGARASAARPSAVVRNGGPAAAGSRSSMAAAAARSSVAMTTTSSDHPSHFASHHLQQQQQHGAMRAGRQSVAAAALSPSGQQQQQHMFLPPRFSMPIGVGGVGGAGPFGPLVAFPSLLPMQHWQGANPISSAAAAVAGGGWSPDHSPYYPAAVTHQAQQGPRQSSVPLPGISRAMQSALQQQQQHQKQQQLGGNGSNQLARGGSMLHSNKNEGSYAVQHKQQDKGGRGGATGRNPPGAVAAESPGSGSKGGKSKGKVMASAARRDGKPDRFAQAARNSAMITALANKW